MNDKLIIAMLALSGLSVLLVIGLGFSSLKMLESPPRAAVHSHTKTKEAIAARPDLDVAPSAAEGMGKMQQAADLMESQQWAEAASLYDELIKDAETHHASFDTMVRPIELRAMCKIHTGKVAEAIDGLQRAIKYRRDSGKMENDAYLNDVFVLGWLLKDTHPNEGEAFLLDGARRRRNLENDPEIANHHPNSADFTVVLANIHMNQHRTDEALEEYARIFKDLDAANLQPQQLGYAAILYSQLLTDKGQIARAKTVATTGLGVIEGDPSCEMMKKQLTTQLTKIKQRSSG